MKLRIYEKLHKLETPFHLSDTEAFITDYVGDIVNLCLNKNTSYRISYVPDDDVYLIVDANRAIHEEILEIALKTGWLPKTSEFMKKCHFSVDEYDANRSNNLIYVTKSEIDSAFKNMFTDKDTISIYEYAYEWPIETGAIFTKGNGSQLEFKISWKELYNKLKPYAVDHNYISKDDLLWDK